jgi:hypothetical protein
MPTPGRPPNNLPLELSSFIGHLNEELVGVVKETMQPAQAGLWLREPRARERRSS